jgi:transposase
MVDTREFGGKASGKGVHMPKSTGLRYAEEFKAEAVQLARYSSERSIRQLAYELGIADQTLRNWIKQAQIDRGEREGLTTQEREELSRLRPENRIRTNAADFAFEDHTGLLKRVAADRAVVALRDAKDAETKLWDLVEVVNRWIVT